MNDYLRHRNLNDLKNSLINNHDFLNNFRHLNYLFNDSRNHNYFLHNFLNLNHPRHLHNFLNDPVDELLLNFHHFFLNDHWNWLLHIDGFDHFLLGRHYLYFFDLYLFDFLSDVWHIDLINDWNLLGDV